MKNYNRLKPKYKTYFVLLVWAAIAIAAYPTWEFSIWLADVLSIPSDVPVKEQENGLLWLVSFLFIAILNMLLACVLLSYVVVKYNGWSLDQALDYFIRYENFPDHWTI